MTSLWNEKTTFSDRNQQIDVLIKARVVDWFRFLLTSARYNALVKRMTFGIMMDSYFFVQIESYVKRCEIYIKNKCCDS